MLYNLSKILQPYFGPFRLLESYVVLIGIAVFLGFSLSVFLLPKFYSFLPKDRGREFTVNPELAMGKPTGAGFVFITLFVLLSLFLVSLTLTQFCVLALTWVVMLTGFFDDRSTKSWGEYLKGSLDLLLAVLTSVVLFYAYFKQSVEFWLPFVSHTVHIHPIVFFLVSVLILWFSINTTNCTDGVDGLSATLVLMALFALGIVFYFILGHIDVAEYLLVPHIEEGATWAVISFSLVGILMGYLWHNAFPSKVLMGDAGSRALGFFIGVMVLISKNPFLLLMTSAIIIINGGTGLLKVVLLRFFKIKIFSSIRFPLHDHMRKNKDWSPTQVLIKFMIMQFLITIVLFAILFKIR
ncbi:MAG: phospho-N-acetylmuramoyl-pentapeptide-transferase [Treponema sp.]|nr:MAG: phospho-N-acetylmuramoyl-pentapeptide-transferase [Treponema sp.]